MPPEITAQPAGRTVKPGESVTLAVEATGTGTLSYQWYKDGAAQTTGTQRTFGADPIAAGAAPVKYRVDVTDSTGTTPSADAELTLEATDPVLLWDGDFAAKAAGGVAAAYVLLLVPLWLVTPSLLDTPATKLGGMVAVQCVIVGAALAAAGLYLALLELRGRARTAEQMVARAGSSDPAVARSFGVVSDIVKEAPAALKAFGELKAPAALLAIAAILFISAAAIGWRSLPDPSPATATPTPVPTIAATPTPPDG